MTDRGLPLISAFGGKADIGGTPATSAYDPKRTSIGIRGLVKVRDTIDGDGRYCHELSARDLSQGHWAVLALCCFTRRRRARLSRPPSVQRDQADRKERGQRGFPQRRILMVKVPRPSFVQANRPLGRSSGLRLRRLGL